MTSQLHICSIDEVQQSTVTIERDPWEKEHKQGIRNALLGMWDWIQFTKSIGLSRPRMKLRDLDWMCHYTLTVVWSRKKRIHMDVQKLVEEWKAVVVTLCTAHDKEQIDAAEYKMDELLMPILSAPIAQLREFYADLTKTLREDQHVPFFIWSMFNVWGKLVIDKCEDKPQAKRLRKKLANEIAEMVEDDVKNDLVSALTGALMWRDPENLKAIKEDIEEGAKPRMRGKESCLFLVAEKQVGRKNVELHRVML